MAVGSERPPSTILVLIKCVEIFQEIASAIDEHIQPLAQRKVDVIIAERISKLRVQLHGPTEDKFREKKAAAI